MQRRELTFARMRTGGGLEAIRMFQAVQDEHWYALGVCQNEPTDADLERMDAQELARAAELARPAMSRYWREPDGTPVAVLDHTAWLDWLGEQFGKGNEGVPSPVVVEPEITTFPEPISLSEAARITVEAWLRERSAAPANAGEMR